MAYDFKKEQKQFYLPPKKPHIVDVPSMNYIAVSGNGNPNEKEGEYQMAIQLLYAVAFTIKMSKKGSYHIENYFDYVVPPLEGLWWQEGRSEMDMADKDSFSWISMIRLPDFVTRETFNWALSEAGRKKDMDVSKAFYYTYQEGVCVQCMHTGGYDSETETLSAMEAFLDENGMQKDLSGMRRHHEIYLSDPRRCRQDRLRTVLRIPVL